MYTINKVAKLPHERNALVLKPTAAQMLSVNKVGEMTLEDCRDRVKWNKVRLLKPVADYRIYVDYPIEGIVEVQVRDIDSVGALVWHIGRIYQQIYSDEVLYGVDLHDIGDLVFEGIIINDDNQVYPLIGS